MTNSARVSYPVSTKNMQTMNHEPISIFFTTDNNYVKFLSVTLVSIVMNTDWPIHFYILDGGISDVNKQKIEEIKKIRDFHIEYLKVDRKLFDVMPESSGRHITGETNYRFIISSIKKELKKCIFLDADLVVDGDISRLWITDVHSYYMAAVTDQASLPPGCWADKLPLPRNYAYVNTGVIVVNLEKWREDGVESKFFQNAAKYKKLLQFPDQDVLNITLAPRVLNISHIFNAMPVQKYLNKEQEMEAFTNPVIIHWAGFRKPWVRPGGKMADVYFKYARLSPFYEEILYSSIKNDTIKEFSQSTLLNHVRSTDKSGQDVLIIAQVIILCILPALERKLRRVRLRCLFSWGRKKQKYIRRKADLKNKIWELRRIAENYEMS